MNGVVCPKHGPQPAPGLVCLLPPILSQLDAVVWYGLVYLAVFYKVLRELLLASV